MRRVDQPIVLAWCKDRGQNQRTSQAALHKVVSEVRQFGWRSLFAPVCGQSTDLEMLPVYLIRNLSDCQHKIVWGIVFVQVDKILQHGQRLMFGGVAKPDSTA